MLNKILLDGSQFFFEIMHLFEISNMCQIFFMIMTPNFHKGSHQYQFTYLSILVIPSRLAAKCENLVITHLLFTCQNSWAFFCPTIFFAVNHCLDFFSKTKISSDSWSLKFLQIYQEILTAVLGFDNEFRWISFLQI